MARRVEEVRVRRGYTKEELARRLDEAGLRLHPTALTKIAKGDRDVSVEDLLALALALDVSPTNLLLPTEPMAEVAVTPKESFAAQEVREWVYGQRRLVSGPPRTVDDAEEEAFFAEAPEVERLARRVNASPVVRQTRFLLEMLERVLETEDGTRRGGRPEADALRDTAPRVRQLAEFVARRAELLADEVDAEVQARRAEREGS